MSLRFFVGEAAGEYSTRAYLSLLEQAKGNPDKGYFVIVPEQFTLRTQREFVRLSEGHSVMDVDILSFNRLAFRVFKELGKDEKTILEETGKSLVLQKIATENRDKLSYFKTKIDHVGYINEIKSLLSELAQYDLYPEDVRRMKELAGVSPSFLKKADDIALLYEGFLDFLEKEDTITAEMVLGELSHCIADAPMIKDAVFLFDGFTGFTPLQNKILEKLLLQADSVNVTAVLPPKKYASLKNISFLSDLAEESLFYMSEKMIVSLSSMAREAGVSIEEAILCEGENVSPAVELIEACDMTDELDYVASRIHACIKEGMRYKDIAVVSGRTKDYVPYVSGAFDAYGIPFFIDLKNNRQRIPPIEWMLGALDVVAEDFSYASILTFLRLDFFDLTVEEIDQLDVYLFASNIRGLSSWKKDFHILPSGFDAESLEPLNKMRKSILALFAPLTKPLSTVSDYVRALKELFREASFEERIFAHRANMLMLAREQDAFIYEKIFTVIQNLLDKMSALLGDLPVTTDAFRDLLTAGIEAETIGMIPQTYDAVIVGDLERTRLDAIKVLFLIGTNDGVIPAKPENTGILTENERLHLKESDFALAPGVRERSFMQRFYLYLMLSKPSQKLFVSYYALDESGDAARPSYLVNVIKRHWERAGHEPLAVQKIDELEVRAHTGNDASERKFLSALVREYVSLTPLSAEQEQTMQALLSKYNRLDPVFVTQLLDHVFFVYTSDPIKRSVMRTLVGQNLHLSVSRLEQYSRCAYAYFLQYILKLKEQREHALSSLDMGSLYHAGLEEYSKRLYEKGQTWADVSDETSEAILQEAIAAAYEQFEKTSVYDKAGEQFVLSNMKETLRRTVWALKKQVRAGSFVPKHFEVSLATLEAPEHHTYHIDEETDMTLTGVIDRVDTMEEDGKVYVKIIDYKSGNTKLDYTKLYHGLQIQLLFYMDVATRSFALQNPDKTVEPAGLLYYHVTNPFVDISGGETTDTIEKKLFAELKPKGLLLNDASILGGFDADLRQALEEKESFTSDVVEVAVKKDGELSARAKVMDKSDWVLLRDYVRDLVADRAGHIADGHIEAKPYRMKKNNEKPSCSYCSFRSVCGFEEELDGYEVRELEIIEDLPGLKEQIKSGRN